MISLRMPSTGSALLSVFLLLATVTVLVTEMTERQFMDIARTSHLLEGDQAAVYAQAAEALAIRVLLDDYTEELEAGVQVDHLNDEWNQAIAFPLEAGAITVQITDLQSRLNLNDLRNDRWQAKARLRRLMVNLELTLENNPDEMIASLVDWLDADDDLQPNGAEDFSYLSLEQGYRSANTLISSIDELLLVKGFTPEVVKKLRPYVTLIKESMPTNINTTDVEVLSLFPDVADPVNLIAGRGDEGYQAVSAITSFLTPPGNTSGNTPPDTSGFTIQSEFFLVESRVIINGKPARLQSILFRPKQMQPDETRIQVISRSRARQFG